MMRNDAGSFSFFGPKYNEIRSFDLLTEVSKMIRVV